jgi:hypothetical protein
MWILLKYIRTALSCHTKEEQPWGPPTISEEDFTALERAQNEPQEPTEAIKRGAELLRRLYGPSR